MFRVPSDPSNPTFDHTFKVGFFQWLTSKKHDRLEWQRRRNAAAKTAQRNQVAWAQEQERKRQQ